MLQGIVIIGKHHKGSVVGMKKNLTHVVNPFECAICGKKFDYCNIDGERIETVITRRKTVVKFHKECYKEMLRKQREGV